MALIGRIYAPDVAVLPIGDHFTMGPREAAVAAELVGAKRVVAEPLRDVPAADRDARRAPRPAARRHRAPRAAAGRDGRAVSGRERWFGATGRKVPELALAGTLDVDGRARVRRRRTMSRRCGQHTPTEYRSSSTPTTIEAVTAALARPEVSCVLVDDEELLTIDLADLTYG